MDTRIFISCVSFIFAAYAASAQPKGGQKPKVLPAQYWQMGSMDTEKVFGAEIWKAYDYLKKYDYSPFIMSTVLSHHECFDGSGYPDNLSGEDIPFGARILRVVDEFAALISDRPYRKAFDIDTAVDIIIEEIKNMDMKIFIEFQRMIHEESTLKLIEVSKLNFEDLDMSDILGINETRQ